MMGHKTCAGRPAAPAAMSRPFHTNGLFPAVVSNLERIRWDSPGG